MHATLCAIRKGTIVQVTRPPLGLWRFHWHELLPIARVVDANGSMAFYLPEVEPGNGRRALCSRLREALDDMSPLNGTRVVVDDCMVEIMEGRTGLLPDFVEADLDAFIVSLNGNGNGHR